jgi:Ala-tRNA(Pro) deacylase
MAIASRLKWFLDVNRVHYDVLTRPDGKSTNQKISDDRRVVSRLFHDARGFVMVVHPASHKLAMPALEQLFGRPLHPARESEVRDIFFDCEKGVIPPLGPAYGIPTVVDDSLPVDGDLYFRGGEADDWVQMSGAEFQNLVADSQHAPVSHAAPA